jgi:hypothetical protein
MQKQETLVQLTNQLLEAQQVVEQFQANVNSLSEKSGKFNGLLATADANKLKALSNKNLLDVVVKNALDLQYCASTASEKMAKADSKTQIVASEIKDLLDKLIYTAEMMNKLDNLIIRKKAANPLISDELVTLMATIGTDANNAIALTLTALQSAFEAQASNVMSKATIVITY